MSAIKISKVTKNLPFFASVLLTLVLYKLTNYVATPTPSNGSTVHTQAYNKAQNINSHYVTTC